MEVSILCLSESFLNSTTFHKKGKLNLLKLDQRRKLQKTRYTEEVLQHLVHLNTIYFFLNAYMHDKPYVPGIIFSQVLGIEKKMAPALKELKVKRQFKQTRTIWYEKLYGY